IVGPSPNGIEFAGKRTTPALVVSRPGVIPRRHVAGPEMADAVGQALKPRTMNYDVPISGMVNVL
nr:hypothetical protein [Tanacetum cinerariifolium]